jgi:hypothetical protein
MQPASMPAYFADSPLRSHAQVLAASAELGLGVHGSEAEDLRDGGSGGCCGKTMVGVRHAGKQHCCTRVLAVLRLVEMAERKCARSNCAASNVDAHPLERIVRIGGAGRGGNREGIDLIRLK